MVAGRAAGKRHGGTPLRGVRRDSRKSTRRASRGLHRRALGPRPPSGGVSRPPLAVIAPHCTQLDGATARAPGHRPSRAPRRLVDRGRHMFTHVSARSRGTRCWMRMWFGWSSRVRFPERKTDDLVERQHAVGLDRPAPARRQISTSASSRWPDAPERRVRRARRRCRPRSGRPRRGPCRERLSHVAVAVQVLAVAAPRTAASYGSRAPGSARSAPRLQGAVDRLGGEDAGAHRVVHALQPRDVHEARRVAVSTAPGRASVSGIEWKPPDGIVFAPHATRSPPSSRRFDERVRLELLEHVVRRQPAVGVLEPHHEADAEVLGPHRVDERAADLAVLGRPAQRPAQRVDDLVERLWTFQISLTPTRRPAGTPRADLEVVERDAPEMALRALGQHRRLRDDLGRPGAAPGRGVAGPVEAHRRRLHATHRAACDQQPQTPCLGLDERRRLLGPLAPSSASAATSEKLPVALVVERRRRRQALRPEPRRHEVDALAGGPAPYRRSFCLERRVGPQLTSGRWG